MKAARNSTGRTRLLRFESAHIQYKPSPKCNVGSPITYRKKKKSTTGKEILNLWQKRNSDARYQSTKRPLFGCVGSSLFTAVPLTSVPTIVSIAPLFLSFHEFSTREGGEVPPSSEACHGTKSPDTKRRVPSLHLYREGDGRRQSRPVFPAGRSLLRAPFPSPRAVPSRRTLTYAYSPVPKPLPRAVSLAPKLSPRDAHSFRSLARAPIARSEVWPVRCSAVPPLRTLARALLRISFSPSPFPSLSAK